SRGQEGQKAGGRARGGRNGTVSAASHRRKSDRRRTATFQRTQSRYGETPPVRGERQPVDRRDRHGDADQVRGSNPPSRPRHDRDADIMRLATISGRRFFRRSAGARRADGYGLPPTLA